MTESNDPPPEPKAAKPAPGTDRAPIPPGTEPEGPTEPTAEPDWETRFKYLLADFENFRKRSDREREALRQRERGELLRGLLPIHEALGRAREMVAKASKNDPVRKGLELLGEELQEFLDRNGVQPVAAVGRPFDATVHEAVHEASATPAHPDGSIAEVVQQGYRFTGGLLRPAKVVVARAPPKPAKTAPDLAEPVAGAERAGPRGAD